MNVAEATERIEKVHTVDRGEVAEYIGVIASVFRAFNRPQRHQTFRHRLFSAPIKLLACMLHFMIKPFNQSRCVDEGHELIPVPILRPGPETETETEALKLMFPLEDITRAKGTDSYAFPTKSTLLFSSIARPEWAVSKLNAPIDCANHTELTHLVLYDGGWCLLDKRQICFTERGRMADIGLDVNICSVQILPSTPATEGLVQAILSSETPSEVHFVRASLLVRAALQAGGLGVREGEAIKGTAETDFLFGCEAPALSTQALPSAVLIECLSQLLFDRVEFSYGMSFITVVDLYDAMVENHTSTGQVFMNAALTPQVFRNMLHYLCLSVDHSGCIQNICWRSHPQEVKLFSHQVCMSRHAHCTQRKGNLQLRSEPVVRMFPHYLPWLFSSLAETDWDW